MLVHGNQPETLRDLLVTWMRRYPLAPLEPEIILAQSNGIAQWLKLALAADATDGKGAAGGGGLGIAAALEISLPSRFLWRVYRAVLGPEAVPEASPFDKSRLVWRLMRLLPKAMARPEYGPLARFLSQDADLRKRFQLAERLADLFDQYQVYRADWLAAWARGEDVLIDARDKCSPLPEEQRWQACLWRDLLADVAAGPGDPTDRDTPTDAGQRGPGAQTSRASVHAAFLDRARDWPGEERPPGLPRRLLIFGISSLPRQALEVLAALACWTQVLMCVHNPCEHFWADIVADQDLLRAERNRQHRRNGRPADLSAAAMHLHAHPLLAAWGKQGRDFISLLDEHDEETTRTAYQDHFQAIGQRIDLFQSNADPHQVPTLLAQLQDDIRDLRPLAETRALWPPVNPQADGSIRFHLAHGPQREVEILHDQLLAAFNADPTLTPRDIIVMVPDIDTYAPHIQAVFGLVDHQDPRYIPFSLADQGRRATDPLVQALATLLALPQSRLAVSDLLDLLEVPALRRRFGVGEDELPRLQRWLRGANIRWGLHAEQRASLDLPVRPEATTQHTWRFGLRRMMLGYAVGQDAQAWRDIEPFDEIGGLDAALLGPLAQLLDTLDRTWRQLQEPATVADWCTRLRTLLADFLAPEDSHDAFTQLQLETALDQWREVCDEAGLTEPLPLSIVGEHWLSRLDEGGLSQRFFAGAVTFATLMPMRAIPFRQVCLLGMNDGDYPRQRQPMDFDLMGRDYRPGDRSRREDDRYLFLEALLSARDRLHVSWVGRSITDNSERPPSVLVGQLRDHLTAGWRLDGQAETGDPDADRKASTALVNALTWIHPLQPFSPRYFPADPDASPWFSYAQEWRPPTDLWAATAAVGPGEPPLPPLEPEEPLTLRDLADFLKAPVKAFFQQRLKVAFELEDPAGDDQEPFALNPLQRWQLNNELIRVQARAVDRGEAIEQVRTERLARIQRRGALAPGAFGEALAEELAAPMTDLFQRYQEALSRWPRLVEAEEAVQFAIQVEGQTLELADWLSAIRLDAAGERGRVVLEISDVVLGRQYRGDKLIRHWVDHLAGHLGGEPLTTTILSKVGDVTLAPLDPEQARGHFTTLMAAWHAGMCRPLPLATKTAFAWLRGEKDGAVREAYEGGYQRRGEVETDPYLARVYPDFGAFAARGEFATWAETLLRPLYAALHPPKDQPPPTDPTQPTGATA
ncbi:MAG: exodeoxyribonuclease V subunit gamma [Chromatiaceae bacterium]|nr:exodeoxyribonuclease V subunit gamma [Chromatiaceae bacterium]